MDESGPHRDRRQDLRRLSRPGADQLIEILFDLLAAVERLRGVEALKVSFYAYPLVNAAHILSVGALVTTVVLMDLRILGLLADLPREAFVGRMREAAALAFSLAAATGVALFSIRAQEYATNSAFLLKMGLLLAAGLNLLAFRRIARGPAREEGYPARARLLAAVSILLWVATLVAGRFIGFI